ncbi:DMT family transporter [Comamonas odontotermitis]|uniref:DMT family transporter n=1 Tax=Comamonas odontotermitis TaxID=379895 RepID=UPI003750E58D
MDTRQALDTRAIGLMLVLCLIWSGQQIVLKATAHDAAPMMQIGLRSGIAAILVWLWMRWRGEHIQWGDGSWRPGLWVGTLFALEFVLVGEGLRHTSAAHMVVLLYTAPIWAALGLHIKLPQERLAPLQWLGIALAFAGIAVAFLWRNGATGASQGSNMGAMLWGDLLALLAGMAWGATTVAIRTTRLSALPAAQTLLYQLVVGCVVLVAVAIGSGQGRINPTPAFWASMAFNALPMAFASLLTWFWLLRTYLASQLGVLTFLTPIFGVILGAWLLHEPIEPGFVIGALIALAGVMLVSGYGWIAGRR